MDIKLYKLTVRYYFTNFLHSVCIRFKAFPFPVSYIAISKICPSVAIIDIGQFHKFFNLIFGGFFAIWANCVARYTVPCCALRSWS